MRFILLVLFFLPSFSYAEQGHEYVTEFVSIWLKDHGFEDFEKAGNDLVIESAGIKISGAIYGVQEKKKDESYLVETRLTIDYKGKMLINEFVASFGATPNEAFINSLDNLCQTTLHPVYGKLIDKTDSHVVVKTLSNAGRETTFHYSGYAGMGDPLPDGKPLEIENLILNEIANIKLSPGVHSAKLVVTKINNEEANLSLTLDGYELQSLSDKFKKYKWPVTQKFYLGKFFLVVSQV